MEIAKKLKEMGNAAALVILLAAIIILAVIGKIQLWFLMGLAILVTADRIHARQVKAQSCHKNCLTIGKGGLVKFEKDKLLGAAKDES